jgi:hypothetical protein
MSFRDHNKDYSVVKTPKRAHGLASCVLQIHIIHRSLDIREWDIEHTAHI